MKITSETAQQFFDALVDRIGCGDMVIDAISEEEAGGMCRRELEQVVYVLMKKVVDEWVKSRGRG